MMKTSFLSFPLGRRLTFNQKKLMQVLNLHSIKMKIGKRND